ncbi:MAG: FAD:protein FMN transferase [Patescibacteria group bacterium]|nr:FAD:protein FMN transferase [Patescibacteria group bacterium]
MRQTELIMGMPITVQVLGQKAAEGITAVFDYFRAVDERFSTYKPQSEISRINREEISASQFSKEMKEVLALSEQTKQETGGYFDIRKPDGALDPSGLVKGWAINNAALLLQKQGYKNFFIDAGGDMQTLGQNEQGQPWRVGIRNPFNTSQIIKALRLSGQGIATSGSYERSAHIYNPKRPDDPLDEIVSLTVIGPDVYQADRFATAAFAMGPTGIEFIEKQKNLEGYMINRHGLATQTSGFDRFVI